MANSVPTLTNENYHMFEPSPLETSLAVRTGDVNAFPLMMSARFRSENAGQDYQAQVNQMHAAQIAEAMMAQRTARMGVTTTALKDAAGAPGMVAGLQRMGIVDPSVDLSELSSGADATAAAKRIHDTGLGLGSMAQGGFTGLAPAAATAVGPGVEQGSPALVQAASIRAAASGGANSGKVTGHLDNYGDLTFSGKMLPGETPEAFKARIGGGSAPSPTVMGRPIQQRGGSSGSSVTSLPRATPSNFPAPPPGVLEGDIPGTTTAPASTAQTTTPDNGIAKAQVEEVVRKSLPAIQKANPAAYADIHAAGSINVVPYKGTWGIQGASKTVYPLNGVATQ
jgi:hypothetical protein